MDPIAPTRQSETTEAGGAPRPHGRLADASPVPGRRLAWATVVAHAMVAGLTQLLWLTYAPIATGAATRLDVSVGAVGWLTNVFPLIYVVLAIPAGLALDRWPRPTMAAGAALVAAGGLARVVAVDFGAGLAGQVLVSIAQPILLGGVAVVATTLLPPASRAAGIAVGSAGVFAGLLLGIAMPTALGSGQLPALLTVQAALAVAGAVGLLATLRAHRTAAALAGPPSSAAPGLATLRALLRDPLQRTLLALAAGGFGAFVALLTWLQALLEPRGIDDDTSGGLLLLLILCGLLTTAFVPALAARRRQERTMLGLALVVATTAFVVLAIGPPLALTACALAVVGAVLLPALPVMLELAEQHAEHTGAEAAPGAASALLWLSGNLAGFAASLAVGAALDTPAIGFGLIALLTAVVASTAGRRLQAR